MIGGAHCPCAVVCLCRSLQQSMSMGHPPSPGLQSPRTAVLRVQPSTRPGASTSMPLQQSPVRQSSHPSLGPWHCPSNVSPDHAAHLANRLLSPNRSQHVRLRTSQECLPASQGLHRCVHLEGDGHGYLPIIPETQSIDESPLCAGILETLPTQTSGVGDELANQHSNIIPRLRNADSINCHLRTAAPSQQRRSQSSMLSGSASAKAARRSGSLAASPQMPHGSVAGCTAQNMVTPMAQADASYDHALAGPSVVCKTKQDGHLPLTARASEPCGHASGRADMVRSKRKRRSQSVETSSTEPVRQILLPRSGECHSAGKSIFAPPVCSQVPCPILAEKPGKRRRITATEIETGTARRLPLLQTMQHSAPGDTSSPGQFYCFKLGALHQIALDNGGGRQFQDKCARFPCQ